MNLTPCITTFEELYAWHRAAAEDPDPLAPDPICSLFFRWVISPLGYRGPDLVCGGLDGAMLKLFLSPAPQNAFVVVPVFEGSFRIDRAGSLVRFGVKRVSKCVWTLAPSLNMPGQLHAFVTLVDVPDPAPFLAAPADEQEDEPATIAAPRLWRPGDPL